MTGFFKSNAMEKRRGGSGVAGLSGTMRDKAYKAVKEFFNETMPVDVHHALHDAMIGLYEGPGGGGNDVLSFESAVRKLKSWWYETSEDVWYDAMSGEILTEEPKPFPVSCDEEDPDCDDSGERMVEPNWEDYTHFDSSDVKRIVFGRELAPYI